MALMSTCCCCLSTKTGTIVTGLVSLLAAFCFSVGFCFALINVSDIKQELDTLYSNHESAKILNMTENRLQLVESVVEIEFVVQNIRVIFIVCLVYYAIYTFASLFMTYGACTGLRCLLLPWIALELVPLALQLTVTVVLFMYGRDDPTLSKGGVYIISGLLSIISFVIHVYWWLCPVAEYQTLGEETPVETLVPPSHPMYPTLLMKY
ncbi:uncharacterized protein [Panulirus ornatus]|uniref:uncharacterized protein n=1 Tax=Panulirus ornatus TaxID=150431 RepID=UPI003A839A77